MDELATLLENQGARTFARLLYTNPLVVGAFEQGTVKVVSAPVDAAFDVFLATYGKSVRELDSSQLGREIIANHLSSTDFALPVDFPLAFPEQFTVGTTKVIFINSVMATDAQLEQWRRIRSEGLKSALGGGVSGNAGLAVLLKQGQIRGNDLLNLCLTNFEAADFCNLRDRNGATIFHRMLKQEFNIELEPDQDARSLYSKYSNLPIAYYYEMSPGDEALRPVRFSKLSDEPVAQLIYRRYGHSYFLTARGNVRSIGSQTVIELPYPKERIVRIGWFKSPKNMAVVGSSGRVSIFKVSSRVAYKNSLNEKLTAELNAKQAVFSDLGEAGSLRTEEGSDSYIVNQAIKERPEVQLRLDQGELSGLLRSSTTLLAKVNGTCVIYDYSSKHRFELPNLEEGTFLCNSEKIDAVRFQDETTICLLSEEGVLWISRYLPRKPPVHTPLRLPGKVLDFSISSGLSGALRAGGKTIPVRVYFLLDDGTLGVFVLTEQGTILNSPFKFPGLVKVPRFFYYSPTTGKFEITQSTIMLFRPDMLPAEIAVGFPRRVF